MNQNKQGTQTNESVQYRLEITFKPISTQIFFGLPSWYYQGLAQIF